MRRYVTTFLLAMLIVGFCPPVVASTTEATSIYERTLSIWDPVAEEDGINICYRFIFLMYLDMNEPSYSVQQKALQCADAILLRTDKNGEVKRYLDKENVNSKLITGLGAWVLSAAYWYTGNTTYAEAAIRCGDFLIMEMDRWEKTYPAECNDTRCLNQHNGGFNTSSLTSYYWTSPNDLGIVGLGIGALTYYGVAKDPYYGYCIKLADALYDMQLMDGSWHDGYALRIPTRWDRSVHYVTMTMMGLWMAYKISAGTRYGNALEDAWGWLLGMQNHTGAVYDIWVDDANIYKAPLGKDNRYDFLQIGKKTDEKEYFSEPYKTYLGEFSFILAGAMVKNIGFGTPGYSLTKDYLGGRIVFSNWYLLATIIENEEEVRPVRKRPVNLKTLAVAFCASLCRGS